MSQIGDKTPVLVHVAVGVILDARGRVLIARRPSNAHQGGLLEFPGGKCEQDEAVQEALARELHEELGIHISSCRSLCKIEHDYGDKHVLLDVWIVDEFTGEPQGREGQPLQWIAVNNLIAAEFPAANRNIITYLQLPDSMAITGPYKTLDDFYRRFAKLLDSGIAMIQLRVKDLALDEYGPVAAHCLRVCRMKGIKLVINVHRLELLTLEADGYHVGAQLASELEQRPCPPGKLLGVSCHDAAQLSHAQLIGADYAFVSPVAKTRSHPTALPLGWDRFQALAAQASLPIYALGGMSMQDKPTVWTHGGFGIASISAFWPD